MVLSATWRGFHRNFLTSHLIHLNEGIVSCGQSFGPRNPSNGCSDSIFKWESRGRNLHASASWIRAERGRELSVQTGERPLWAETGC